MFPLPTLSPWRPRSAVRQTCGVVGRRVPPASAARPPTTCVSARRSPRAHRGAVGSARVAMPCDEGPDATPPRHDGRRSSADQRQGTPWASDGASPYRLGTTPLSAWCRPVRGPVTQWRGDLRAGAAPPAARAGGPPRPVPRLRRAAGGRSRRGGPRAVVGGPPRGRAGRPRRPRGVLVGPARPGQPGARRVAADLRRPAPPHRAAQAARPRLHRRARRRPRAVVDRARRIVARRVGRRPDRLRGRLRRSLPRARHRRDARRAGGRPRPLQAVVGGSGRRRLPGPRLARRRRRRRARRVPARPRDRAPAGAGGRSPRARWRPRASPTPRPAAWAP